MKKEVRKLSLKKETVTILDKAQSANVIGGGDSKTWDKCDVPYSISRCIECFKTDRDCC